MLLNHFNVEVDRVMFVDEALERMKGGDYALVLFNRLVFADGSEGLHLVRTAKRDPTLAGTPMMMISNYADAQAASVAAGAEPGFGKKAVGSADAVRLLSRYLPPRDSGR
jgi:hypothetical protein